MKALDKLKEVKELLECSGIEDAAREAEIIIAHHLSIDRATLYRDNPEITEEIIIKIERLLKRRAQREPLQYILGYVYFFDLEIKVGQGVLIPRPETELLAEEATKTVKRKLLSVKGFSPHTSRLTSLRFLDLCTGSGCLALKLAKEFPDAQVYGTDISEIAIQYSNENAELNRIKNVIFMKGPLFEPVKDLSFNLIISNPPYVKTKDIDSLQPEIKDWEPREALNGGENGLDYYRLIIPAVKNYLKESGYLMLEIGINQADSVMKMAKDADFENISLIKDYAGVDRIFIAKNNILIKNQS